MNIPRQHDRDYLIQQLWRSRVWMNLERRKRQPTERYKIPRFLRKETT
jgi:hypothetical protein